MKTNNTKLEEGQTLFYEFKKRGGIPEIRNCQIERIAKKYFYLKYDNRAFNKDTLLHENKEYHQLNEQLYLTAEEIELKWERQILAAKIKGAFNVWGDLPFTLEQLRSIDKIISNE